MILLAGLLISLASAGEIDWSANLCEMQRQFFQAQYANRVSFAGLAEDAKGAEVVLMGESHAESNGPFYADFLSRLKHAAPDLDCVTFELDRRIFPQGYVRPRWDELAARATELGLRVFKIDHCLKANDHSGSMACPDGRNAGMTNKLNVLIKKGICHRILHTGGLDHLQTMRRGAPPNLAERLRAKNISSYRIAVVDTALSPGTQAAGLSSWVWGRPDTHRLVCAERPGKMRENFAFLNRDVALAGKVPVLYSQGVVEGQAWSDYDAALVVGCENEAGKCDGPGDERGYLR